MGHAVLAIGYDNDPLYGDYVIIKNSHGRHWGEFGYARISLTKDYGYKGFVGFSEKVIMEVLMSCDSFLNIYKI